MADKDTPVGQVVHDVLDVASARPKVVAVPKLFPFGQAHQGEQCSCLIREGTTGQHSDFGNTFSERFNLGIGKGFRCVNVQLSGWSLNFRAGDHHIDQSKIRISNVSYDSATGNIGFTVSGVYRDQNGDDDFYWEVWYTILALG